MGFMAQPQPAILPASPLARQGPVKEPQSELTAHWRPDNNPLDPTPTKPQQLFSLRLQPLSSSLYFCWSRSGWQIFPSQWLLQISADSYATTDWAHLLFSEAFPPAGLCEKKPDKHSFVPSFFFFLPTEAAVFEFNKKEREGKKTTCGVELLSFFSLLCSHEVSAGN